MRAERLISSISQFAPDFPLNEGLAFQITVGFSLDKHLQFRFKFITQKTILPAVSLISGTAVKK